jgi:CRISPR-associated exonuclease Cas4
MFTEEELLPLSALQHLVFCERQCALIHIEQAWSDNALTLEGSRLHHRTDEQGPRREVRGDVVILRGIPLRSFRLGVSGKADVVEFHRALPALDPQAPGADARGNVPLPGLAGTWKPYPVEYKRGKPKKDLSDRIQLCAQAICLEEMLEGGIPEGALFYGRIQRRCEVLFDAHLRGETESAAHRLHELICSGITPKARKEPKCNRCSLLDLCLPRATGAGRSARAFFSEALSQSLQVEEDVG